MKGGDVVSNLYLKNVKYITKLIKSVETNCLNLILFCTLYLVMISFD